MNAIVTLLTAASVLAHAALGCCFHHSHEPSPCLTRQPASSIVPAYHAAGGPCCGHDHGSQDDNGAPDSPRGQCEERNCVAVAGTAPILLLKAAVTAINSLPHADLLATAAASADYVQWAGLEHDLGPPVRPHLFHRVLLI
jgi:hypothetical protein